MPIQKCKSNGKFGYKFGTNGKCYTYVTERGRLKAIEKAKAQGRAIKSKKNIST